MVLPASGQLTTAQILAEFNQTGEFVTSSYYRGGGIVPATSGVTGGVAEVQTVGFSGTAANTLTPGQDETVTISLDDRFNAGPAIGQYPATGGTAFSFAGSATTSTANEDVAAGTMTIDGGISTWSDRGTFTNNDSSYRIIRYDGSTPIQVSRVDISLNITSASDVDTFVPLRFANFGTESTIRADSFFAVGADQIDGNFFFSYDATVSGVVERSDTNVTGGSSTDFITFNQNDCFVAYFGASTGVSTGIADPYTAQDFTIRISITGDAFTTVTLGPASYRFSLDTSGEVFSVPTEIVDATITLTSRDTITITGDGQWDVRDSAEDFSSNSISYSDWNGWVGNWFRFDTAFADDDAGVTIVNSNRVRFTFSSGNTATFNVSQGMRPVGDSLVRLDSIVSQEGTPATSGGVTVEAIDNTSLTGTFAANANASTALTTIGTAITNAFSTVTVGAVQSTMANFGQSSIVFDFSGVNLSSAGDGFNGWLGGLTSSSSILANELAFHQSDTLDALPNPTPEQLAAGVAEAIPTTDVLVEVSVDGTSVELIFDFPFDGETATLQIAELNFIQNPDVIPQATVTSSAAAARLTPARSVEIDTNQNADIAQMLTITANDGTRTVPNITAIHGTAPAGIASSYTITDYDNMQVGVGTATSAETLNSALSRMVTAINLNQETPIDFRGAIDGSNLVLTAQSVGSLNPGTPSTSLWSITVDHSTGDGDIAVTGVTRTTRGRDTLSNINPNVPDGSQGNTEITYRMIFTVQPEVTTDGKH